MPMEFAHCVSAVCCSDPQEKNKQSFHRTTGRALLHKHGLGLVCVCSISTQNTSWAALRGLQTLLSCSLRITSPAAAHADSSQ